jgi:hypothetical protein
MALSQEEIIELKEKIAEADRLYVRTDFPRDSVSRFVKMYSDKKPAGLQLYAAYSDDELNGIAIERARKMGGKLKDFYLLDIYFEYFKMRHLTWKNALKNIGLIPDVGGDAIFFYALEDLNPNIWFTKYLYQMFKSEVMSHDSETQLAAAQVRKMLKARYRWEPADVIRLWKIMRLDALNRRLGFSGYELRPVFDCTREMAAVREIAAELGREPNINEIPDEIGIMLWLSGYDKQDVRELIAAASQPPAAKGDKP